MSAPPPSSGAAALGDANGAVSNAQSTGNSASPEEPAPNSSGGAAGQPGRFFVFRSLAQRLLVPVRAQLTQGTSPDQLALTLGVGSACSLFPFLGFTALLNLGVGVTLRLNQPILQTLNQLLGPLQLPMILVYVRVGESLWGATGDRFTITEMLGAFRDSSIPEFLSRFGWAGIHALTAWAASAPAIIFLTRAAVLPALRRLAAKRPGNTA